MAPSRFYSSTALQTTLTGAINGTATTIAVASTTGFPGSTPFTLALDYGAANEELVEVTMVASLSLTVTRAIDGTSGVSHNPGAVVRHVSSGRDFADSRAHEAATANVHGVTGVGNDLVGTTSTQTLTNKTLTLAGGSLKNINLLNQGASGTTQVIGDSTNPSVKRLRILDNEVNLSEMVAFSSIGAMTMIKRSGEADNVYRFRVTDNDGTTDRWAVLSGGTMAITPTSATTSTAVDIIAPDTSSAKRSIRIAASGGGTERFTVWNDGRVDIVGNTNNFSQLDVTAASGQSAAITRWIDSSSNTLAQITATGLVTGNRGVSARADDAGSTVPLRVFANNPGPQTANLQEWVDQTNTVVAFMDSTGKLNTLGYSGIGATQFVRRTSDASRANDATPTNDSQLTLPVVAGATYVIGGTIIFSANASPGDITIQWNPPSSSNGRWTGLGLGLAETAPTTDGYNIRADTNNITQARNFGGIGAGNETSVVLSGILRTTNSGNMVMQWSQGNSSPTATVVSADSYFTLYRVS